MSCCGKLDAVALKMSLMTDEVEALKAAGGGRAEMRRYKCVCERRIDFRRSKNCDDRCDASVARGEVTAASDDGGGWLTVYREGHLVFLQSYHFRLC